MDATARDTPAGTSAPVVETRLTALSIALEHRKREALTPYLPRAWDEPLEEADLTIHYSHILEGLRLGFRINLPVITHTQSPPNRASIAEHSTEFNRIVQDEITKGRYFGPLSQDSVEQLIGPFQSSPFSIIPKPGKPGRYRIVQNFSFPHKPSLTFINPSINSFINSNNFPTTWGTFSLVSLLIRRLPKNAQAATRDVAEAYRTIPLHSSQWPAAVVRLDNDEFAIDTSTSFGVAPSAGIYGEVHNAAMNIMRSQGIGPISAWVDDHIFFRMRRQDLGHYNSLQKEWHRDIMARGRQQSGGRLWFGGRIFPDGTVDEFDEDCRFPFQDLSNQPARSLEDQRYSYNFADIDEVSKRLGIPWETTKDAPFGHQITHIGFEWDISAMSVVLGTHKKEKYTKAIQEWQKRTSHQLSDVEKLYGKLLHSCLVVPSGRAYVTGLEAMLGTFHNRPFLPWSADKHIRADLQWWIITLSRQCLERPIPGPVTLVDVGAFSDASSGFGIAIVVRGRWRAWRLIPGWQTLNGKRDIGWAEAIGFECLVRYLGANDSSARHFTIFGDNKGVVEGWWNGRSRNPAVNDVFKRLHSFIGDHPNPPSFHTTYVASASNPADAPSRGIYPSTQLLLPPIELPESLNNLLIDSQLPVTPLEQRARDAKRHVIPPPQKHLQY